MWGELRLRLLAPLARVERRVLALACALPLLALGVQAGWRRLDLPVHVTATVLETGRDPWGWRLTEARFLSGVVCSPGPDRVEQQGGGDDVLLIQDQPRFFAWQSSGWLGCAVAALLLSGLFTARFMTLARRVEQELAGSIALAALALLFAEKLRWILAHLVGWSWAAGEPARRLLSSLTHEQWFFDRALVLPASVLAFLWLSIGWLRIERGREEAQAREAADHDHDHDHDHDRQRAGGA